MNGYRSFDMQQQILTNGSREMVIHWLEWNDPNGVYSDADSIAEGLAPLTLEQARKLMKEQLDWIEDSSN